MRDLGCFYGKIVRVVGCVTEVRHEGQLRRWLLQNIFGDFQVDHMWLIEKQLCQGSRCPGTFLNRNIVVIGKVGAYLKYAGWRGQPMQTDFELRNYRVLGVAADVQH
jgi:hypothetical protein